MRDVVLTVSPNWGGGWGAGERLKRVPGRAKGPAHHGLSEQRPDARPRRRTRLQWGILEPTTPAQTGPPQCRPTRISSSWPSCVRLKRLRGGLLGAAFEVSGARSRQGPPGEAARARAKTLSAPADLNHVQRHVHDAERLLNGVLGVRGAGAAEVRLRVRFGGRPARRVSQERGRKARETRAGRAGEGGGWLGAEGAHVADRLDLVHAVAVRSRVELGEEGSDLEGKEVARARVGKARREKGIAPSRAVHEQGCSAQRRSLGAAGASGRTSFMTSRGLELSVMVV